MNKILFVFLKYTFVILVAKDGTHRFNVYNPVAYLLLLVFALVGGLSGGLVEGAKLIFSTFNESVKYKFEWSIVLYIVGGLIYLAVWLL